MKIDFNHALIYYFKDSDLLKKILLLYLIFIASFIPIIGLFLPFLISGYLAANTNSRIFRPNDSALYEWRNISHFFKTGCKTLVPLIISFFPLGIGLSFFMITAILGGLAGAKGGAATGFGYLVFFVCCLITLLLVLLYLLPAYLVFTTNLECKSFFNFKAITFILSKNHCKDYLHLVWYYFLFTLATIIIPFVIFFLPFILLAFVDINAQFVRQVFAIARDKIE